MVIMEDARISQFLLLNDLIKLFFTVEGSVFSQHAFYPAHIEEPFFFLSQPF